jgi:hypothetical protein
MVAVFISPGNPERPSAAMAGPVLYSTNPWFTELVCEHYRNQRYHVWCSEVFDPASVDPNSLSALTAPSSSPKSLYYDVLEAVRTSDQGNQKIISYRKTFRRLARDWFSRNEISRDDRDDILAMLVRGPWRIWKPRLYVIPRHDVEESGRLYPVPVQKRAGIGPEFQILDLRRSEFDTISLEQS